MADNVAITAGSGTTVSTEEVTTLNGGAVSAQHVQRIAAAIRTADGAAVDLPGSTADGLLVNLGANNDVTVTGSLTANAGTNLNTSALALEAGGNLAAAAASLSVVDDWDESDRAKVNPIVGQAGVASGAGAVGATTQRVTLASDDPAVAALQTLDNAIAGTEMQVDVVAALPAGTNNIGDVDVASIAAGDNNIGNVDIVTMPNVTLASTTNTIEVVGDAAHDAAVAGNPVLMAARANTNEPTAVSADGDVTHLWADLLGRLVIIPGHPNPDAPVTVNATASGNTTVIAAPGASLSLYICKASVHNRDAANVVVALQDGAGGTSRWRAELAAEGGGALIDFGARGWKLTANTLLNVNLSGAGSVDVNVTEYYIAA